MNVVTTTDLPSLPMAPAGAEEVRAPAFGLAPGWASWKRPYYQDASVTLYHGDARQIVPMLGRFDLLLTDPPYGINADNRKRILSRGKMAKARDYGETQWDESAPPRWRESNVKPHKRLSSPNT